MWCADCDQKVDFNSVAVSSPRTAMTLDLGGDVDPTVVTSAKAQVINVCKNCGSQNLYPSKAEADFAKRREAEKLLEEERMKELMKDPNLSWGKIFKKAVKWTVIVIFVVMVLELVMGGSLSLDADTLIGVSGPVFSLFAFFFIFFSIKHKGNDE